MVSGPEYRYLVESRERLYDGSDAADAMAAWSKAVGDGVEYVTMEALLTETWGG